MKLSLQHWLIIIAVILFASTGILTYKFISLNERAEALEEANDIYEEDINQMLKENDKLRDSIKSARTDKELAVEERDKELDELFDYVQEILKNPRENEEAIDNMRDADSVDVLFSRHLRSGDN